MNDLTNPFFCTLPNRGLIHIEGEDRYTFLQGLISNDANLLKTQPIVYSCLLTPQGKFLHDFFMIQGDGFILLDCEGGARAQDLYKRLNMYRLRAKVNLSVEEESAVYAVFDTKAKGALKDPRHPDIGYRGFEKPETIEEKPFSEWDTRRIHLTIPDGSSDMIPMMSTLLECNIDKLNGVSFTKGCYIGQEITARMHHRGLTKKHLRTVNLTQPPFDTDLSFGDAITSNDKRIGEMRSRCGDIAIAQIKDDVEL